MSPSANSKSLSAGDTAGMQKPAYLANYIEIAFDAIVAFNAQEQITLWNPAAERMYGWSASEALGRTPAELFWPVRTPQDQETQRQRRLSLDRGETLQGEYAACRKDGSSFWVEYSARAIFDERGKVSGYMAVYRDITARKLMERGMAREQEALYKLADQLQRANSLEDVFNAALGAILSALQCDRASILLFDDMGVMQFVAWHKLSDGYRKFTNGHSPWKLDEKNPEPISIDDIDTAEISEALKAVIKEEGISSLAFIPLVSNDRLIGKFMTYFNAPHEFSEAEVDLSMTIARQLASGIDRKHTEDKLRQAASFDEAVVGNMGEGLYTVDSEGRVISMNPAAEKMFGWTFDELRGRRMHDVTHYKHPDGTPFPAEDCAGFQVLHHGQKLVGYEDVFIRRDETFFDVVYSSSPLLENGKINGLVVVFSDNTTRKQAEKRLALLAEISELMRKFEDPYELQYAVSKAIGEHLQVKRCLFNETDLENDLETVHRDYYNGVESVAGVHKNSDYSRITSAEMQAGKTVVNYDSKTDPRTEQDYERSYAQNGERAYIAVPLMRENIWVATLWVSDDKPRQWSKEEVSFLETVAERTWTLIEKLRIAETLRASEALYRTIARSIPGGGVYVVDKDFRYLVAEGPVTEAFGIPREMLEGHTVSEVFSREASARMMDRLKRNFAGETLNYETKQNGRIYWTQQAPLLDSIGQAIIVTIDITERKHMEDALRESEERFARFMEHLPGLAWIKDVQGHYVYANAPAERAFNTPREKLYGKTDQEIFPPEVAAQFRENDERALTDVKGVQVIETLQHDDGVLHYSLVSKFPIPGLDGNIALIGGTAFDITERKQAEEALRESELRFRTLANAMPSIVWTAAPDGTIVYANDQWYEYTGISPKENSKNWPVVLHPEDYERCLREWTRALETVPDEYLIEVRNRRYDGQYHWFQTRAIPVRDGAGKVTAWYGVTTDIHDRILAEQALRENEKQLQALNETLEQKVKEQTAEVRRLASDLTKAEQRERHRISHILHDDLQQRLYAIQMQLTFLRGGLEIENPAVQRDLADMKQQLDEILAVTRHLSIDLSPPILHDEGLAQAIGWLASQMQEQHGLNIELLAESSFAIPDEELQVLLFNCVRELLFNVLKHAGVNHATVALQRSNADLRIEVRDAGKGFDAAAIAQPTSDSVYEDKHQQRSFGLPTLRHRLSLFGGQMDIKSEPDAGTAVSITIPINAKYEGQSL